MTYDKRIPSGKQLSQIEEKEWMQKNPLKDQKTFFPRSISLEDIDKSVYSWFTTNDLEIDGVKIPVHVLTTEKWAEFVKRWKAMDNDRNVTYPYITMRRSNTNPGQDPIKARIPNMKYTTYRVPFYTPAGPTYKLYKVPAPIRVDLEYQVRILTHYIKDINTINEILLRHFASLQAYLDIDKHYMPMTIESISDESNAEDIQEERVIHTLYSIKVKGYLIDEKEFEEKIGISNILVDIREDV